MDFTYLTNTLESWAIALGVLGGATLTMAGLRRLALYRIQALAERSSSLADDLAARMLRKTDLLITLAVAAYLASLALELSARQRLVISRVAIAALLLQLAIWGDTLLRAWRDHAYITDAPRRASRTILCFLMRLALWLIAFLMVLDNFGFNITALVASLGIGGIAVALAVQNIVGDVLGSVEHIGLKTTRLRGLGGQQVIFANSDLLKSRIHNHKRMETRRVAFVLRVAYGATDAQLAHIPTLIREVVEAEPMAAFERAHFFDYGEWSLNFEVVYHFQSPRLHRPHGHPRVRRRGHSGIRKRTKKKTAGPSRPAGCAGPEKIRQPTSVRPAAG